MNFPQPENLGACACAVSQAGKLRLNPSYLFTTDGAYF